MDSDFSTFNLFFMKKFLMNIIFLIIASFLYGCSYASPFVDTIPLCILKMKEKDSLLIVDKYDYKGQQWFGVRRILTEEELIKVNYIKTILFYDPRCNQVATWRTGGHGIIIVDKILPDTIDKTKIVKVEEKVPEKIIQLAIKNNAASISEYQYLGQTLYFLDVRSFYYSRPEKRIESYYDKNGNEIIYFKKGVNPPPFSRMDAKERNATAHPEELLPKGIMWHNPNYVPIK